MDSLTEVATWSERLIFLSVADLRVGADEMAEALESSSRGVLEEERALARPSPLVLERAAEAVAALRAACVAIADELERRARRLR